MEPEFARRLFAWIRSKDGAIGIGSSWRPNPSSISKASREGKSFHQTQTFADGTTHFCAVDLVVPTAGGHSSGAVPATLVPLQGSDEARRWGVHVNVGTFGQKGFESWHMQPIEIDGWGSWVSAGRKQPVPNYHLPDNTEMALQPSDKTPSDKTPSDMNVGLSPFAPEFSAYGHYPDAPNKAELRREYPSQPDDLIRYLQGIMRNQCHLRIVDVDGYFGQRTEDGLKSVQRWNGLEETGRCGPETWVYIDAYAAI
jgi:peptidoglycan hydrolase-like protein with peptidoglycan-binding domain